MPEIDINFNDLDESIDDFPVSDNTNMKEKDSQKTNQGFKQAKPHYQVLDQNPQPEPEPQTKEDDDMNIDNLEQKALQRMKEEPKIESDEPKERKRKRNVRPVSDFFSKSKSKSKSSSSSKIPYILMGLSVLGMLIDI